MSTRQKLSYLMPPVRWPPHYSFTSSLVKGRWDLQTWHWKLCMAILNILQMNDSSHQRKLDNRHGWCTKEVSVGCITRQCGTRGKLPWAAGRDSLGLHRAALSLQTYPTVSSVSRVEAVNTIITPCGFAVWVQGYNYSLSSVCEFLGVPSGIIPYCGFLFGNDFLGRYNSSHP